MKLWQKIYIMTLLVVVLIINCGIFGIFYITYKGNLRMERERTRAEFTALCSNINADIRTLAFRNRAGSDEIANLIKNYESYYGRENVRLKAWLDNKLIYQNDYEKFERKTQENEVFDNRMHLNKITIERKNDVTNIWVCSRIGYDNLYLYYTRPLKEIDKTWDRLIVYFVTGSFILSVLIAIVLSVVLRRGLAPIGQLTQIVKDIADGDFSSRVSRFKFINGNFKGDEISVLAKSVNNMADKIEESIEKLKDENESRQNFIDNLTHELRTPLTSIYGFAEYLQKAKVNEDEKKEAFGYIMSEAKRIQDMTSILMNMMLIRNNTISIEKFDLSYVFMMIENTEKLMWQKKNVRVTFDEQAGEIYGNRVLTDMLLRNLIHNAINAVDGVCGAEINVKCFNKEKFTIILVKDNGCGIASEELKHIKEPFYRVDKDRSRKSGGAGLGLALCEQITSLHGGSLEFKSKKGIGTTAEVKLLRNIQ